MFFLTATAKASNVPLIRDAPVQAHQACGRNIQIQLSRLKNNYDIIGLKNNKTKEIDFFRSTKPSAPPHDAYIKFEPVKYDMLSKSFLLQSDDDIDIICGASINENKQEVYSLSLGTHIYSCGAIQK